MTAVVKTSQDESNSTSHHSSSNSLELTSTFHVSPTTVIQINTTATSQISISDNTIHQALPTTRKTSFLNVESSKVSQARSSIAKSYDLIFTGHMTFTMVNYSQIATESIHLAQPISTHNLTINTVCHHNSSLLSLNTNFIIGSLT